MFNSRTGIWGQETRGAGSGREKVRKIRAGNSKSVGSWRIYIAELNIWQSRKGYRDCKVREAGRLENKEKYRKTNNSTGESVA